MKFKPGDIIVQHKEIYYLILHCNEKINEYKLIEIDHNGYIYYEYKQNDIIDGRFTLATSILEDCF